MATSDTAKVWTDEDIRALCNQNEPTEAIVLAFGCLQRITIALESIAAQGKPATLFEQK